MPALDDDPAYSILTPFQQRQAIVELTPQDRGGEAAIPPSIDKGAEAAIPPSVDRGATAALPPPFADRGAEARLPPPFADKGAEAAIPPSVDRGATAALPPPFVDKGAEARLPPPFADKGAEATIPPSVDKGAEAALPQAPATKGQIIWTTAKGLHPAEGGETGYISLGNIKYDSTKGLYTAGSAVDKPSLEAQPAPPGTAPSLKPGGALTTSSETPASALTVGAKPGKLDETKGASGQPPSATTPRTREDLPPVTPKAPINPRLLVELEKSNPTLHDNIIQAANAAGIGSYDLANLVYASSKGDPNYNEGGRVGLTGVTQEDIAKYQAMYPQLFADAQGNPISPSDPHVNLLVGALKYREVGDIYGPRTASAIAAYRVDPGRINQLAQMTPAQRKEYMPADLPHFVSQVADPTTPASAAPKNLDLVHSGTMTAPGVMQAAMAARRSGDATPFIQYAANGAARGMSSNDIWRRLDGLMVGAMIAKGDMTGAQAAREMVFQMSHVGANQALMQAYKMMDMGDDVGAAQKLAQGYFATPDGGHANFSVTSKGVFGQRYNEATGKEIGAPFQVTKERLLGMMNMVQDPNTFAKTVRDSQKLNAEIEDKHADVKYKEAHADYLKNILPSLERRAETAAEERALGSAATLAGRLATAGARGTPNVHADNMVKDYFPLLDPLTRQAVEMTPAMAHQIDFFKDMVLGDPHMSGGLAKLIAGDLVDNPKGGRFKVEAGKDGGGVVVDRTTNKGVAYLSPAMARQLIAVPVAPASPIGATPQPAAGR